MSTMLSAFKEMTPYRFFLLSLAAGAIAAAAVAQEAKPLSVERTTASVDYRLDPQSLFKVSRLVSLSEIALDPAAGKTAQVLVIGNTKDFSVSIGTRTWKANPLEINGLAPGTHQLWLSQDGYKPLGIELVVKPAQRYELVVELQERSGTLIVEADRAIQVLHIDGSLESSGAPLSLPVGSHRVRVRHFGFYDYDQAITIQEDIVAELMVHFVPAPFEVSDAQPSRARFRPRNPGSLGTSELSFEVSGPGSGRLSILDAEGRLVRSKDFASFDTWHQGFVWDGKDKDGVPLPDGKYGWLVEAKPSQSSDGSATSGQSVSSSISIDSSSFIKYRSTASGSAGLPLASDAYRLGEGAVQFGTSVDYLPASQGNGGQAALQFSLSGRIGLAPQLELDLQALGQAGIGTGSQVSTLLGINLGWSLLPLADNPASPVFGLALNLGGAIPLSMAAAYPFSLRSAGLSPGGRLGLVGQMGLGPFHLLLEPVVFLSPWEPFIAEAPANLGTGTLPEARPVFFAAYNAAAYLDFETWMAGLSCSLQTDQYFAPSLPLPLSLWVQFLLVDGINLSLSAQWSLSADTDPLPRLGLGFGLLD